MFQASDKEKFVATWSFGSPIVILLKVFSQHALNQFTFSVPRRSHLSLFSIFGTKAFLIKTFSKRLVMVRNAYWYGVNSQWIHWPLKNELLFASEPWKCFRRISSQQQLLLLSQDSCISNTLARWNQTTLSRKRNCGGSELAQIWLPSRNSIHRSSGGVMIINAKNMSKFKVVSEDQCGCVCVRVWVLDCQLWRMKIHIETSFLVTCNSCLGPQNNVAKHFEFPKVFN